jgi:hypothetical protein
VLVRSPPLRYDGPWIRHRREVITDAIIFVQMQESLWDWDGAVFVGVLMGRLHR